MSAIDMVFDADCVLCSGTVHFILRHERAPLARFVNAWSPTGLELAIRHGFTATDLDETFLIVADGRIFTKSDAALIAAGWLRRPWRWLGVLRLLPRPWRDALYTAVARRRYRWFGKKQKCFVAPPGQRGRFVDH